MKREFIKKAEADLLWVWQQNEVPLDTQWSLVTLGYCTMRKFAGVEDSRASVRAAFAVDLLLDVAAAAPAGPQARIALASLVAAWESARDQVQRETQLRAESKALNIQRPIGIQDRTIMRKALEVKYGRLQTHEVPSAEYLACKSEEVETGEPSASTLDEVTSLDDTEGQSLQATLDISGSLKILKKKGKIALPSTSEELRARLKVEANTWMMLSLKYTNVHWLQGLERDTWFSYADFFLGEQVSMIEIQGADGQGPTLTDPWKAILGYEQACRRWAFKKVREEGHTLDQSLKDSIRDSERKEVNFTSPIALGLCRSAGFKRTPESSVSSRPEKAQRTGNRGEGGGKGNSGGKGGGKGKNKSGKDRTSTGRKNFLSYTPDGRQICFKFNNLAGCSDSACDRVHVCQVPSCGESHAAARCPMRPGKGH